MNRIKNKITGLLLVLTLLSPALNGKGKNLLLPLTHGEQITLLTDRPFYVVSEKIYFTALYKAPADAPAPVWSTVVYIELLRWDGTKLGQTIAPVRDGRAEGMIQVPATINSGNYYLRAYTKWMRNFSPYTYTYLPVSILNPRTDLVDKGPESGSAEPDAKDSQVTPPRVLQLSGLKDQYTKREEAELSFTAPSGARQGVYSLDIVKATPRVNAPLLRLPAGEEPEDVRYVEFLPETDGLTVSGKVRDRNTGQPLNGAKVSLSSFNGSYYYLAVSSDEEGFFYFTLPDLTGEKEFHLSVEADSSRETEILITSEFCNKPVTLPYFPFSLEEEDRALAAELALNAQISERFTPELPGPVSVETEPLAFYGKPLTTLFVKDYIELNDLEEFFYELVYKVSISHDNKGQGHLVVNAQGTFGIYPPLVLMDNIPVANDNSLLGTPSRRIERIEVINKGYVCGSFKYSGIISIFSRNHDLAGLQSEMDNHFFAYRLFDPEEEGTQYSDVAGSRLPDRRNLLYHDPELRLTQETPVPVRFTTPDGPGTYIVRLQSVGAKGGITIWEKEFRVE